MQFGKVREASSEMVHSYIDFDLKLIFFYTKIVHDSSETVQVWVVLLSGDKNCFPTEIHPQTKTNYNRHFSI